MIGYYPTISCNQCHEPHEMFLLNSSELFSKPKGSVMDSFINQEMEITVNFHNLSKKEKKYTIHWSPKQFSP